jgi:hypothetical protein
METCTSEVATLHKVTLQVMAGRSAAQMDILPEPVEFCFILGLGSDGLTPFEMEIIGKKPGETVSMTIDRHLWCQTIGHLTPPCNLPPDSNVLHLDVVIKSTHPAPQREVIKALADVANRASCGGDCDCGCGCG